MSKHRYQLLETKTLKRMTDKLEFVFVEVAKFNKREDELETDLDKWLYLLKNMSTLLERPAALRDRVFGRLFDVAENARLDDEERKKYVEAMNTTRDTFNMIAYARKQTSNVIARRMIDKGLDMDTILDVTGLPKEDIAKITQQ